MLSVRINIDCSNVAGTVAAVPACFIKANECSAQQIKLLKYNLDSRCAVTID